MELNQKGNTSMHHYFAFGLSISSTIVLPELIEAPVTEAPDVSIITGETPENLSNATFSGVRFQAAENNFLLKVKDVASFLVCDGNKIVINPSAQSSEKDIRLFLLGSAFGALFHQRGLLPVHGSAIVYNHKAIIFSGISGAGKSTLAAAFHNAGYSLLADDICVIALNQKTPMVYPGFPQMKLWADSLKKLEKENPDLKKVRDGILKYAYPTQKNFYDKPVEVGGLYIVNSHNKPDITIETIKGIEKFNILKENTYRVNFIKGIGNTASHFKHIESLARTCFVKKVARPSKEFKLKELKELIENDFKNQMP
jgi:hypothetical protein